ncbi:hypothetical protein [uncultured Methylobacterium sp.]|uniref:hypothetical protein n=1 Tax=uncultured Methylobacterium sp. TaxID=157278 RepID=UPI0035C9911C
MTIKPVLAALSLWALATPVLAQGTAAQRAACSPDAFRLCASHIPDVGAITACLRAERSRLSPACRTAMDEASPAVRQAEARPAAPRTIVERAPARPAARLAARRDERPTVRRAAAAPAARVSVRQVGRVRVVTRTVVVYRDRPRHAARRRNGYGSGSQMAQAAYWMQRIGGMSERFGGPSIAGMMGMLQ